MFKVALLGTSHPHAVGFYNVCREFPDDFDILGYADVPPYDGQDKREKALFNLGARAVNELKEYDDYKALLDEKPDIAMLSCDNKACADIACEALDRKILTVVEKPMCENVSDAIKMAECAKKNSTPLFVNWPIAWFPAFNEAKKMVDNGDVGTVMRVTYRSPATWGPYSYSADGALPDKKFLASTWWYHPERGGGSLLDYAGYGAALSTWFFGKPAEAVSGIRKNFYLPELDVEDFSAMLLDFGDGVGLLEGSWSTFNCGEVPSGPIIHGTEGTIVCDRHSTLVKLYKGRSHTPVPPFKTVECASKIPELSLGKCLIDYIKNGTPVHPLLDATRNVQIMAALDAGRKSSDTGITVKTVKY